MKKYTKEQCKSKIEKFQDKYLKWEHRLKECKEELVVGNWYYVGKPNEEKLALVYFKGHNVKTYGFKHISNDWTDNYGSATSFKTSCYVYILATDKEVQQALEKEAVKRGFKEGVDCYWKDKDITHSNLKGSLKMNIDPNYLSMSGKVIYMNGVWATFIEEPVYEWQWLCIRVDKTCYTSGYYKKEGDISCIIKTLRRIEETKRERK